MAALAWFGFKQTCYRNSHSLSGFWQHDYRTKSPHLSDLLFLNGDQSRQGAVGMLELVTCGGEGEEGAQLWVPWAQPGAPGWPAAPSSWERRTSCMAAGPSSCVGDGKATCPRHWAPGFRLVVIRRAKNKNLPQSVAWTDDEPTAVACPSHAYSHASSDQPGLVLEKSYFV